MARSFFAFLMFAGLSVTGLAQSTDTAFSSPYYARAASSARLFGGPGDQYFPFRSLQRGEVVRVIGQDGNWSRIAPPGDLFAYMIRVFSGRQMLVPNGNDLHWDVAGDDVQVRGRVLTSDKDYPTLGEFQSGDRVIVLDFVDARWARIAYPFQQASVWVPSRFLKRSAEQAEAKVEFQESFRIARRELLASGAESSRRSEEVQRFAALNKDTDEVVASFRTEEAKDYSKRDVSGLRERLMALRDGWPEGSRERDRLDTMLRELDEWDRVGKSMRDLEERANQNDEKVRDLENKHREDMKRQKEQFNRERADFELPRKVGTKFAYAGWVRRVPKVRGVDRATPDFYLEVGGRRAAYLRTDRYDLSDYVGLLIGIRTLAGEEFVRPGDKIKTLPVRQLEIVHTGR